MAGVLLVGQGDPPPPPPFTTPDLSLPPVRWPPPSSDGDIVLVLFISFVALLLVFAWVGYWNQRARAAAAAGSPPEQRPAPLPRLPGPRVVREDGERELRRPPCTRAANPPPPPTARLPAFAYSHRLSASRRGAEEEAPAASTCSVCLTAFRLGETVRLLPACLHLYHAACIDPWLDAHSTCPICRSDADPSTDVAAARRPPPV